MAIPNVAAPLDRELALAVVVYAAAQYATVAALTSDGTSSQPLLVTARARLEQAARCLDRQPWSERPDGAAPGVDPRYGRWLRARYLSRDASSQPWP